MRHWPGVGHGGEPCWCGKFHPSTSSPLPEITCPNCWHEFDDSDDYGHGEDIGELACGECGRAFYARRLSYYVTETIERRRGLPEL